MNGLRTTRAVVIDDLAEEALPFIESLSVLGVGAIYYNGSEPQLPKSRLRGIRLVAADLDLGNVGTADSDVMLAPLLAALDRIIADDNGPFLLIVWTKHEDYVEDLRDRLERERPGLLPFQIVTIAKAEFRSGDSGQLSYDIDGLGRAIMQRLASWFPVGVLIDWEQRVHDAATDTTSVLTELTESSADREQVLQVVMAALARSGPEGPPESGVDSIRSLHGALNALHVDNLESLAMVEDDLERDGLRLAEVAERPGVAQKAEINRRLWTAPRASGVRPGNVYYASGWDTGDFPVGDGEGQVTRRELLSHLLAGGDATAGEVLDEGWEVVLVDGTAPCDHAQGKAPVRQLFGGVMVPANRLHGDGKVSPLPSPSVRPLGEFRLASDDGQPLEGDFALFVSSRFVFGRARAQLAARHANLRIRQEPLADLLAWLSAQGARPGFRRVG